VQPNKKSEVEKKDKDKDKKKELKATPGPGYYDMNRYSIFPNAEKKDQKKAEKKPEGDKEKKKKDNEDPKLFGVKINKVPGPGTYDIKRELLSAQTKLAFGGR